MSPQPPTRVIIAHHIDAIILAYQAELEATEAEANLWSHEAAQRLNIRARILRSTIDRLEQKRTHLVQHL
jgi:hypothetical protein